MCHRGINSKMDIENSFKLQVVFDTICAIGEIALHSYSRFGELFVII